MSKVKWINVMSCSDGIRANLIATALHEEEIPAVTFDKQDSNFAMLGAVYVLVPESKLEQARRVLVDKKIVDRDAFEDE